MPDNSLAQHSPWPDVHVAAWAPTKRTLHLCLQMLGKLRVALSPVQPNWIFTALHLTARGLTTGPMPYGTLSVQASLDVFLAQIIVTCSNGQHRNISLANIQTIAEIFSQLQAALQELGVVCALSPIPQEIADITPFDEDHRPAEFDVAAVQRWFQASTAAAGIFDEWRSHFFGRTGIQVWWGALDVALLLFSGKHVEPPTDRGYLMKYDLDAEMMNVGLYFGDENNAPFFYGYIYPQPPTCETASMAPASAQWSDTLKEWVLPYDAVRAAADPAKELQAFLDAIYTQCTDSAGWDRSTFTYVSPGIRG
jgi:hypothetical protein